jgi:hypothetical protein
MSQAAGRSRAPGGPAPPPRPAQPLGAVARVRQNDASMVLDLTPTQISLGIAGATTLVAYVVFILVPACASYGRVWEKFAAGFLSLFILAALVGVGVGLGAGIIYLYVQQA